VVFATVPALPVFRHLVCDDRTLVAMKELSERPLDVATPSRRCRIGVTSDTSRPVASEFPQHGHVIGYLQHEVEHEQS
jgi:hypothetical protein